VSRVLSQEKPSERKNPQFKSEMGEFTLRRTTCLCAVLTMVAQVGCFFLLFSAFSIRGDDLVVGSSAYKFANLGTCVSSPHVKNLENAGYNDAGYSCSGDEDKAKKFGNLVQASVHSLYWASQQPSQAGNYAVQLAAGVAMTSIMGGETMPTINASLFYDAVVALNSLTPPASCDTIYGRTSANFDDSVQTPSVPKPVLVSCDGSVTGSGSIPADVTKAYTHCVQQHSFGRHGPDDGTYAMPLVPNSPGPMTWPWANVSNFNETSPWDIKARMMIGARFSWSVTAYIPMALATAFFAMHSAAVVLAEVTYPDRASRGGKMDRTTWRKALYAMAATTEAKRALAFVVGVIVVLIAWSFWIVCILAPWGFASRLGRPQCEENKREGYTFMDMYQLEQFYSRSGWKIDWTAHVCEVFVLACCTFTLVAIPLSEQLYQFPDKQKGKEIPVMRIERKAKKEVPVDSRSMCVAALMLPLCILGTTILITGCALVQNSFGMAWARAVSGETGLGWDAETIALPLYDMAKGWMFAVITAGMVSSAVLARWTINGMNCNIMFIFYIWVAFAVGAFVPTVVFFDYEFFSDEKKAVKECAIFDSGGSNFDKEVCRYRWFGVIIGTVILAGVVVAQTILGTFYYIPNTIVDADSADVPKTKSEQIEGGAPAEGAFVGYRGYRSNSEHFFNFSTQIDTESTRKLLSKSPVSSEGILKSSAQTTRKMAFALPIKIVNTEDLLKRHHFTA